MYTSGVALSAIEASEEYRPGALQKQLHSLSFARRAENVVLLEPFEVWKTRCAIMLAIMAR
jgi:hypothetical protein